MTDAINVGGEIEVGDTRRGRRTPLDVRFWAKVEKTDGCWNWTGHKGAGYGHIRLGGRTGKIVPAHRVSYELLVGAIPDGLQIDHLCRNRACVNPTHLEPVTPRENVLRGNSAKKATHCKRGHEKTPENCEGGKTRGGCKICRAITRLPLTSRPWYQERLAQLRAENAARGRRYKTHCKLGHPLDRPPRFDGSRCSVCTKEQKRLAHIRRKEIAWKK